MDDNLIFLLNTAAIFFSMEEEKNNLKKTLKKTKTIDIKT
jgi:hypothetical protein